MNLCICSRGAAVQWGESRDVLIVLEQPTQADNIAGHPFALAPKNRFNNRLAYTSPGQVMIEELQRLNLNLNEYQSNCLWLHEPTAEEKCFIYGRDLVLDAAKGKKVVLLCGNLSVEYFTGYNVDDVNGLKVSSAYLSAKHIIACVNPSHVFKHGVGELRFALQTFKTALEEEHLL